MTLTVQLKLLPEDPQALLSLMENFNVACNWLSKIAFEEKLFHWLPLQRRTYYELREKFGLHSQAAKMAIRKVAYAYKNKDKRNSLAEFRLHGSVPLWAHSYQRTGTVSIYGLRVLVHNHTDLSLSGKKEGKLSYQGGQLYIHQCVEIGEADPVAVQGWLGCDLGIVNLLVDSEGETYSGEQIDETRRSYSHRRRNLQKRQTASAKRKLRRIKGKQSRYQRDQNHVISKRVVQKAKRHCFGIALEELSGIRSRITVRRPQRSRHANWAFAQLRSFIEYKALRDGVPILLIDPRNTSKTCPLCGHIEDGNRRTRNEFQCRACGCAGPADYIAALNISARAKGNWPNGLIEAKADLS